MADVFISHSSKDHLIAEQLCANLEANGISCWMAPRDIKPGEEWARSINNAITAASVFIVIYSANSCQSTQVPKEIGLAGARNIYIVPYKIDDTPLTGEFEYYLLGSHWITADIAKNDYKINELYNTIFPIIRQAHDINDNGTTFINNLNIETVNATVTQPTAKKKSIIPLVACLSAIILVVGVVIGVVVSKVTNDITSPRTSVSEDEDEDEDRRRDDDETEEDESERDDDTTEQQVASEEATTSRTENSNTSSSEQEEAADYEVVWDGTADTSWYNEDQTIFNINTAEQLAGLAQLVSSGNSMDGVTINLTDHIYRKRLFYRWYVCQLQPQCRSVQLSRQCSRVRRHRDRQ